MNNTEQQKMLFDTITIEVTRKCNLKCAHCYRGDSQNIDINLSAIDNLLAQTAYIGDLVVTGGEALLNLSAIRYLFEKIKDANIQVGRFYLITNGTIFSDEFCSLMMDFHTYIRTWSLLNTIKDMSPTFRKLGLDEETEAKFNKRVQDGKGVRITCSVDRYHDNNWGKEFFEKCNRVFEGTGVIVNETMTGEIPRNIGNGTKLNEAVDWERDESSHVIAYFNPKNETECKLCPDLDLKYTLKAMEYDLPYIFCGLYLSADGKLYDAKLANIDFATERQTEPICDLNTPNDIFTKIKEYNVDKPFCSQAAERAYTREQIECATFEERLTRIGTLQSNVVAKRINMSDEDWEKIVALRNYLVELIKANPSMPLIDIVKEYNVDFAPLYKVLPSLAPPPKPDMRESKYFRCSYCKKNMIYDGQLIHCKEIAPGAYRCEYCGHITRKN